MKKFLIKTKGFFLNIFFPIFCLNCQKEGKYLCDDCFSLIDFSKHQYCPFCQPPKIVFDGKTCDFCRKRKNKKLDGLFFAVSYDNFIIKKLISQFKYSPYIKELSKTLAFLIINHLQLFENRSLLFNNKETVLIPVPLTKKKLKERGFNQAEEIARHLSSFFKLPLISNVLIKTKENLPQVELAGEERKKNVLGVFLVKNKEEIIGKKVLLIDDIFTTGSTMEECARLLKEGGAKEIWGITIGRG